MRREVILYMQLFLVMSAKKSSPLSCTFTGKDNENHRLLHRVRNNMVKLGQEPRVVLSLGVIHIGPLSLCQKLNLFIPFMSLTFLSHPSLPISLV